MNESIYFKTFYCNICIMKLLLSCFYISRNTFLCYPTSWRRIKMNHFSVSFLSDLKIARKSLLNTFVSIVCMFCIKISYQKQRLIRKFKINKLISRYVCIQKIKDVPEVKILYSKSNWSRKEFSNKNNGCHGNHG